MQQQTEKITKAFPRMMNAFESAAQKGFDGVKSLMKDAPLRTSFAFASIGGLLSTMSANDALGIVASMVIFAGTGFKSNRELHASLSGGSAAMTAHLSALGNWPGALQSGLGAVRTAVMNAIGDYSYKTRVGTSAAAFAAAGGTYLAFQDQAGALDYVPLAAIGLSAAGGAFPEHLSRYTRALSVPTVGAMAAFFVAHENPSIQGAFLNALLMCKYMQAMYIHDREDIKRDMKALLHLD